jgi:hypothetical protein
MKAGEIQAGFTGPAGVGRAGPPISGWVRPALASPDLVLEAQPPAQPHSGVVVERPVRFCDVRPARPLPRRIPIRN